MQFWKRITGFGKSGIGYHIPPGCGKTEHLRLTSLLQSLFNFVSNEVNDTKFVAIGQVILRPYGSTFQRLQKATFNGYRINLWFSLLATRLIVPRQRSVKLQGFGMDMAGVVVTVGEHSDSMYNSVMWVIVKVRTPSMLLSCSLTVRALCDKGSR